LPRGARVKEDQGKKVWALLFAFFLNEKRRGGWLVRLGHPALERKARPGKVGAGREGFPFLLFLASPALFLAPAGRLGHPRYARRATAPQAGWRGWSLWRWSGRVLLDLKK